MAARAFKLTPQYESALSKQVAEFRYALPRGWKATTVPNGGLRHPAVAGKVKAEGLDPGFPDWAFAGPKTVKGIGFIVIELKRDDGSDLEPEQETWRDALIAGGTPWFLCRTIDEVIDALKSCGVALRIREEV